MTYPALLWTSTAFALLGSLSFGFQIAVLNTSLPAVAGDLGFDTDTRGALASSAVLVGALFGALGAGTLADTVGPKRATVLNALPLAAGSLLAAAATSQGALLAGRLLAGVGTGAASLLVPRYLSEIAPTPIRGLLSTLNQLFINVGVVAAFAMGWPYERGAPSVVVEGRPLAWWRAMLAAGAAPAAVQALGMAMCPETPAWLRWSGRRAQAAKALRRLHGAAPPDDDAGGGGNDEEEQLLLTAPAPSQGESGGFAALLDPRYRRVMLLAVSIPLLQQLGGINTVILYGSEVFRLAGVESPVAANLAMGGLNLTATAVAAALVDRLGRKRLLTWSFAGMGACLAAMAAFLLLPSE